MKKHEKQLQLKEHFIQIKIDSIVEELINNVANTEQLLEKIQNDEELNNIDDDNFYT